MITLIPMTETDFQTYLQLAVVAYAQDKIEAGNWTEAEALKRSQQEFEQELPQGIETPANFLFLLINQNGEAVGYLWYNLDAKRTDSAFIYDFEIYVPFRRQGYATQALKALETHVRLKGVKKLGLHVFGQNTAARELYKKAGYLETNVNMSKEI